MPGSQFLGWVGLGWTTARENPSRISSVEVPFLQYKPRHQFPYVSTGHYPSSSDLVDIIFLNTWHSWGRPRTFIKWLRGNAQYSVVQIVDVNESKVTISAAGNSTQLYQLHCYCRLIQLHGTSLHCTKHRFTELYFTVLHCIDPLYCIVLNERQYVSRFLKN